MVLVLNGESKGKRVQANHGAIDATIDPWEKEERLSGAETKQILETAWPIII
jgi:hypothetical protein